MKIFPHSSLAGECSCAIRCVLVVGLLALATACAEDEQGLPGERIPVRQVVSALAGDSALEAAPLPDAVPNQSWPQFAGSSGGGNFHPEFAANFAIAWEFETRASINSDWPIAAEPVIAHDHVFLLDANSVVHAVDVNSGQAVWSTSVVPPGDSEGEGIGGGLGLEQGVLYVATGYGEMLALDARSGQVLWNASVSAPVHAAPVIADGRVAAVARDDVVHVFDAGSGKKAWTARGAGASVGFLNAAAPAARDGVLVVPFASGELIGYETEAGGEVWKSILSGASRNTPMAAFSDITSSPVIGEDRVFAGTRSGAFAAVDWRTGEKSWERGIGPGDTAWVMQDSVYLVDVGGNLLRLSADDGGVFWRYSLPAFEDPEDHEDPILYSGPIVAGGLVLVASSTGQLFGVDAEIGTERARFDLGAPATASPIVAGGIVYVFLNDGRLLAIQ